MFEVRRAAERPRAINWAEVAQQSGFADQAHMCREIRRVSVLSPAELRRRVETDEAFWLYRLWS